MQWIAPVLMEVFNCFLEGEKIPVEIKSAIICLLWKPNKDPHLAQNLPPIVLLNMDYKLFTKILNERIKERLDDLILPNQSGFVPSRYIVDNILTMEDNICYYYWIFR